MANSFGFSAVGWVHYRIAGGARQIAIISGAYAAALVGLVAFVQYASRGAITPTGYSFGARLVLFLQTFVLLVFGTYRVSNAIRLDLTSNMIESHRLMPIRPGHAVLGYIIGATSPAWTLGLVNVLASVGLGVMGGGVNEPGRLVVAHAILASFALFVWTLTALAALTARAAVGGITGLPVLFLITNGAALSILPGLLLLSSPLLGGTIFLGTGELTMAHVVSFAAQLMAGSMIFLAAARRYRLPDQPAILPLTGVVLAAVWVGLSLAGIEGVDGADIWLNQFWRPPPEAQLVTSLLAGVVIMLAPVANAAWFYTYDRRNHPATPAARREAAALWPLAACTALALVLTRAVRDGGGALAFAGSDVARAAVAGMIVAGFLLGIHYTLRIVYRGHGTRGFLLAFIYTFTLWAVPLILDFLFYLIRRQGYEPYDMGFMSTLSPVGNLAITFAYWGKTNVVSPVAGAGMQLAVGLVMAALFYTGAAPQKPAAPAPASSPSPGVGERITGVLPRSNTCEKAIFARANVLRKRPRKVRFFFCFGQILV